MKRLLTKAALAAALVFGLSGCADKAGMEAAHGEEAKAEHSFEKKGFMTTKWCADRGIFKECPLESYVCGYGGCWKDFEFGDEQTQELVLYVHGDHKYYNVELTESLPVYELEELAFNRNEVTLQGEFDEDDNTIIANHFDAPPPPKKSFFKGCL